MKCQDSHPSRKYHNPLCLTTLQPQSVNRWFIEPRPIIIIDAGEHLHTRENGEKQQ